MGRTLSFPTFFKRGTSLTSEKHSRRELRPWACSDARLVKKGITWDSISQSLKCNNVIRYSLRHPESLEPRCLFSLLRIERKSWAWNWKNDEKSCSSRKVLAWVFSASETFCASSGSDARITFSISFSVVSVSGAMPALSFAFFDEFCDFSAKS